MKSCTPISKTDLNRLRHFSNIHQIRNAIYHAALLQESLNNISSLLPNGKENQFILNQSKNLSFLREVLAHYL